MMDSKPNDGKPGCVLFVDDERAVRELGRRILERAGYQVVMAEDGQSALKTLEEMDSGIDLVVLDLCMPDLSGLDVLRRIRAEQNPVGVLLATGLNAGEEFGDIGDDPNTDSIQKPYPIHELVEKVNAMMESGGRVSQG